MPTRVTRFSNCFQLFKGLMVFPMYIKACEGAEVLSLEHGTLCLLRVLSNELSSQTEILLLIHLFTDDHVNCAHSLDMEENIARNIGGVAISLMW